MQSLLNPRNLFHISSSDLDIQEGQHVQTSDFFKFAFLIQTHTRKWLQINQVMLLLGESECVFAGKKFFGGYIHQSS